MTWLAHSAFPSVTRNVLSPLQGQHLLRDSVFPPLFLSQDCASTWIFSLLRQQFLFTGLFWYKHTHTHTHLNTNRYFWRRCFPVFLSPSNTISLHPLHKKPPKRVVILTFHSSTPVPTSIHTTWVSIPTSPLTLHCSKAHGQFSALFPCPSPRPPSGA